MKHEIRITSVSYNKQWVVRGTCNGKRFVWYDMSGPGIIQPKHQLIGQFTHPEKTCITVCCNKKLEPIRCQKKQTHKIRK